MRRSLRAAWLMGIALATLGAARAEYWEAASGKFEKLTGCRYVPSGADDGDSFVVKHGGDSFLFRLYSVDTPETTMSYPARVTAQAAHFGITEAQAVKVGLTAEAFSRRLLAAGPFTVETCWQDAKGASQMKRSYAVVTLSNGKDLSEELAAAGLARVYGFTPTTAGFSLPKLQGLERLAKSRQLGAFGLSHGGTPAVAANSGASRLPPTISAFARPAVPPSPPVVATGGKVNVNTATETQLLAVPGIGPHYAREIIAGRPYEKFEDIKRVRGIGPKNLAKLAPYLTAAAR